MPKRNTTEKLTADEFINKYANKVSNKYPTIQGTCRLPVREQMVSDTEFNNALERAKAWHVEFQRQYHLLPHVVAQNNAAQRARTAAEKQTEEGRAKQHAKMKRDQVNKKARFATPTAEGMAKCSVGPHDVKEEDMMFCPVADLGIVDYNGPTGRLQRHVCKNHFAQSLRRGRKHEAKPERKEYKKILETFVHVRQKRRQWRIENRTRYNAVRRLFFRNNPDIAAKRRDECRVYQADPDVAYRIRVLQTIWSAEKRGIAFKLTDARMRVLFSLDSPCFHCDVKSLTQRPLGPDRLVPTAMEYTDDGTVTCCKRCNFARGGMPLEDFRQACRNIVLYQDLGIVTENFISYVIGNDNRVLQQGSTYADLVRRAKRMGLTVELTRADHKRLQYDSRCYLCGVKAVLGVDRKDSALGYTLANSFPCCTSCNMMKKETPFDDFLPQCRRIADKWPAHGRA